MYFPRSFFCRAVFRVSEVALCFAAVCATATAQFEERGETPFPEGAWSIATGKQDSESVFHIRPHSTGVKNSRW